MKKTFILLALGVSFSMAEANTSLPKTDVNKSASTEIEVMVQEVRVDRIARSARESRLSRLSREVRLARVVHYVPVKASLHLASSN